MAGIANDGSTPQERAERRAAERWRDYRPLFAASDHDNKDVHVRFRGPKGGTSHYGGDYTVDELIEVGVEFIQEAQRRRTLTHQQAEAA
jgi:hypothetical protein